MLSIVSLYLRRGKAQNYTEVGHYEVTVHYNGPKIHTTCNLAYYSGSIATTNL